MTAPRVAYLTSRYPAVSHTFIRREVLALRRRGLEVVTFSVRALSPTAEWSPMDVQEWETTESILPTSLGKLLQAHGRCFSKSPLRYVRTWWRALRVRPPGLRALLWSQFYFAEAVLLADRLRQLGVTRLHCHFANAGAEVGALAAFCLDLPWSVTVHGSADFTGPPAITLAAKLDFAEFVAFASFFGRAQALRLGNPSAEKRFLVVRCGVDPGELGEPRTDWAVSGTFRFLTVCRLSPEKGLFGVLQAIQILRQAGMDVTWQLVGDGPLRSEIAAEVRRRHLDRAVELSGTVTGSKLADCYRTCDGFVLGSFLEGVPVVLMEAMTLGLPVVAPRVAGVPELVEHQQSGLLFTPSDFGELAERMKELVADAGLRERLSRTAQAQVRRDFDLERSAAMLDERFRREAKIG